MTTEKHPYKRYTYPDGSERDLLEGKVGKDGKWYTWKVCDECGKKPSAKVHS